MEPGGVRPLASDRAVGLYFLYNVGPVRANGSVHAKIPCMTLEEV